MDIIIFKAGRMIGPLDRESVIGMLARGEVSENDLAQRDGLEVWTPLRREFPPPPKPTRLELAWNFSRECTLKFWQAWHVDPLRVGLASLLFGCLLIIFPRWTFMLFVPALASAVFAGALLLYAAPVSLRSAFEHRRTRFPRPLSPRRPRKAPSRAAHLTYSARPPSSRSFRRNPTRASNPRRARPSKASLSPIPVKPTPTPRPVPPI